MTKYRILFFLIILFFSIIVANSQQYQLKEVVNLGKLAPSKIQYNALDKEWLLSNGYFLFSLNADFSRVNTFFNTYPNVHYDIQKLPTKNLFIRHFNNSFISKDFRKNRLDSSAFYIMGDSLKSIKKIIPSTYIRVVKNTQGNVVELNAINNCHYYGKDSTIFCNNATLSIYKTENNISKRFFLNQTNFEVKSVAMSSNGQFAAFGFRDSGFYFVNTNFPNDIQKFKPSENGYDITGFYFDEINRKIYVEESNYDDFRSFQIYSYENESLKLISKVKNSDWGINDSDAPQFAFNFKHQELFIKYGLRFLLKIDFKTNKVVQDFTSLTFQKISQIHSIYFNSSDDMLYLSATDFKNAYTDSAINKMYKLSFNRNYYVNIIQPKNLLESKLFFNDDIKTVINELPEDNYFKNQIVSFSKNDLALFPVSADVYTLYNIRNGNMIKSFKPMNHIYELTRTYLEENNIQLSPNGKYIYEWMVLKGAAYNIVDTLLVGVTNLITGEIKQGKISLVNDRSINVKDITWDENDFPVFASNEDGHYLLKKVSKFVIDTTLVLIEKSSVVYNPEGVLYESWPLYQSENLLTRESKRIGGNNMLLVRNNKGSKIIVENFEKENILFNQLGFLVFEYTNEGTKYSWYNNDGSLIYNEKTEKGFEVLQLSNTSNILFLKNSKEAKLYKMNLTNGELVPIDYVKKVDNKIYFNNNDEIGISFYEGFNAWQLKQNKLTKLYENKYEKDFIKHHQFTNNQIVSDGRIWSLKSGQLIESTVKTLAVLSDTTYIGTTYSYELYNSNFETNTYKIIYELKPGIKYFGNNSKFYKPDEKLMNEISYNKYLFAVKNFRTGKINALYEIPFSRDIYSDEIEMYPFNNNQSILFRKSKFRNYWLGTNNAIDTLIVLDLITGKMSKKITGLLDNVTINDTGNLVFALAKDSTKDIYTTNNNELIKVHSNVKKISCFLEKNEIAYMSESGLVIKSLQKNIIDTVKFKYFSDWINLALDVFYDYQANAFYITYNDGGLIKIDNNKKIECRLLPKPINKLYQFNNQYLIGITDNGNYTFINKNTLEEDLKLLTFKGRTYADRQFIWLTKENYYLATPGIEKEIHFVKQSQILPVKQMDFIYNRPDKVLEILNAPKADIDFYKKIYSIRANKYKGLQNSLLNNVNLELDKIVSNNELRIVINKRPEYRNYYVSINGCPQIIPNEKNNSNINVNYKLNSGENLIYAWAENEEGKKTNYTELKYYIEKPDSGKWYFLGVGVSKYKDSSQNLKYADKDIRDISKFLRQEYPTIVIDTLLNENATTSNIISSLKKLKNTQPDDKILISFSGHGLLDSAQQFWFATNNIQFNKPSISGFSINNLTTAFNEIPARYRLVTLDACHSGEKISINNSNNIFDTIKNEEGTKGNTVLIRNRSNENISDLLKKMQLVFTDQISNTGINVIAASSGSEFAFESKDWNNGVFTYSLLNGWQYAVEKENSNKGVHYRDLKSFIQKNVTELTNGKQTPNTIMENGEINWWLKKN